jgi:2,3-bisphosphoglycerate-independent phosphoglycerate mutase
VSDGLSAAPGESVGSGGSVAGGGEPVGSVGVKLPPGPRQLPAPAVCLVVLDGWGLGPAGPGNAVSLAHTPVFDELWATYPHTQLTACGRAVGLPEGQMGNSEVGHLNLGAGAVVRQDLARIDDAVADGSLVRNEALRAAFSGARRVHLLGLVSDGGVHSGWTHLRALVAMAGRMGVEDLVVHAFTDGRDTLPHAGAGYLETVEAWLAQAGSGRVGSVVGRYFAMDRDSRWDRIQLAYDMLVHGRAAHHADSAVEAVRAAYERGETDEFIAATTVGAEATIGPEDSVVAFNFRPDRMRQLTRALAGVGGDGPPEMDRGGAPVVTRYTCMTEYREGWPYPVAFPPERPQVTLSGVLAAQGMRQLHVAETEKYPHVTYFFNGGEESAYAGERRELVASPRDVPTYDHKPQMSASEAARAFTSAWREDGPGFGIINFANADMVGHTGVVPAAVTAIETVDACLGEVVAAVHESGGACVVTADHGNADHMLEPDGSPNTAHSLNPVPLIVTVPGLTLLAEGGILADVAPTVLDLLGVRRPRQMTGGSLLVEGK